MSPRRTLVVATAFLGLVFAGPAASAIPVRGVGQPSSDTVDLRERLRTQFERSFRGVKLPALKPGTPTAPSPDATTSAATSANPFPGLAAGQFAAYASATVNHTAAPLAPKGLDNDLNLATAHAAHAGSAVPAWKSEIGREAFPALVAGSSQGKALAAEIGPSDGQEEDSQLPLDPAVAKAPPSKAPVVEKNDLEVPPALKTKALRAEASARAIKTGCVLGSDLALGLANADDTEVGDLKGDPKSPQPFLSVNADEPPRAVSQSLSRARLVPNAGQAGRFGVLAETRQTVAPVTLFKGDKLRELTIEVAGEWILRSTADGSTGAVTLGVEESNDDDRPLLRIISRDEKGKPVVTEIADIDELSNLDEGAIDFGPGLQLVLAEAPRGLRAATGTKPQATGTLAAGAVDILRIQGSDDPEDAVARVGHMEAAVAVPGGGATCPGIGVAKRSSQSTVDAGRRFSWQLELSNPNDCILDQVKLVDTTQPSKGLVYTVVGTSPAAKINGDTVTFEGIGPLSPGATKTLRIDVQVDPTSAAGRFTNQAVATGLCGSSTLTGTADDETQVEQTPPFGLVGRAGATEPAVHSPEARTAQGSGGSAGSSGDVVVRPAPFPGPGAEAALSTTASSRRITREEATRTAGGTLARTGSRHGGLLGTSLFVVGLALRRLGLRRRR
jgi:uncharacterized protein DUF11